MLDLSAGCSTFTSFSDNSYTMKEKLYLLGNRLWSAENTILVFNLPVSGTCKNSSKTHTL